ncbi:MAG: hypothetical protein E7503_06455 [Ruminococcus sp.]|nr:hypothetical protein [Ruminococcus sp.]
MDFIRKAVLPVGIPVSGLLLLGSAAIATAQDLSPVMYRVCGAFSLMAGSFLAGLWDGRRRRHKGIWGGLLCGLAVTAFWGGAAWIINGGMGCSLVGLWAVLGGICGGVWGVNLPAPVSRGKSHRGLHLRQKWQTAADLRQKRKYRRPWKELEKSTRDTGNTDLRLCKMCKNRKKGKNA